MSGPGARLTLVIPPLSGTGPAPRLPALERLLARGTREPLPGQSFTQHLASLFGLTSEHELPLGALCRVGERGAVDDGWWFCAAPAHFFASRDRLRLASVEQVQPEEAEALVALFNGHFAADGWELEAASPAQWYLRAPGPQALRTRSLDEASQADLRGALPEGPDALHCHRFLNEAQMLFHGSAVNVAREQRGLPAVNGIWFWGGGRAPSLARVFDQVWSDLPLVRGLALVSGAGSAPLPGRLPAVSGDSLAVIGSDAGWATAEAGWFAPAERALQERHLAEVIIDGGARFRVRVNGAELRRWWRLSRSLEHYQ